MEPITDTYWPVFKQAAEDDVDKVRPIQLTCIICRELMTTSPSEPNHNDGNPSSHAAWIMPCGHMFGLNCLMEWIKHVNEPNRQYLKCPVCSTTLPHHPNCGHKGGGQMIPDSVAKYSRIPPLLSAGGLVAPDCARCEVKRALRHLCMYTRIYEPPNPELPQGQGVGFCLYVEGVVEVRSSLLSDQRGVKNRRLYDIETPRAFLAVWNIIKQDWALKANHFFYDVDLREFEFATSVFQSVSASPDNSLLDSEPTPMAE